MLVVVILWVLSCGIPHRAEPSLTDTGHHKQKLSYIPLPSDFNLILDGTALEEPLMKEKERLNDFI